MMHRLLFFMLVSCAVLWILPVPFAEAQDETALAVHSRLWGEYGEAWTADGRLSDVSFAGYRRGEQPIPSPAVVSSVRFCTFTGVRYSSERRGDKGNHTGHHGVILAGDDNLFTAFDVQTRFLHDVTVTRGGGNVVSAGRGVDLNLDHHRYTPHHNVFTDLHAGQGTRLWKSGGGCNRGRSAAGHNVYWNLRADRDLPLPPESFSPAAITFVAIQGVDESGLDAEGRWIEPIAPGRLQPADLHQAQLQRRLQQQARE